MSTTASARPAAPLPARAHGVLDGPPLARRRDCADAVTELDLDAPDEPLAGLAEATEFLALVRLHRHPLGVIRTRVEAGYPAAPRLRRAAVMELGLAIQEHERRDLAGPPGSVPPCLRRRARLRDALPPITVIVTTRDRHGGLERCLDSLAALDYPRYEVFVPDAPVRPGTTAPDFAATLAAAEAEACGRILAFTRDDSIVDRDWLLAIAEGFTDRRVGCVTGLIMPGPPRRTDFEPLILDADGTGRGRLPPPAACSAATSANLAFDADLLRRLPGPATLHQAIAGGRSAVYQPGAVVWQRRAPAADTRHPGG